MVCDGCHQTGPYGEVGDGYLCNACWNGTRVAAPGERLQDDAEREAGELGLSGWLKGALPGS